MGLGKAMCCLRFSWASFSIPRIRKPSRGLCALLPAAGLGSCFYLCFLFVFFIQRERFQSLLESVPMFSALEVWNILLF